MNDLKFLGMSEMRYTSLPKPKIKVIVTLINKI